MGMVGSINAPATGNTFIAFKAAAVAIGSNEATETDQGAVTGGVNAQATASPAATFSASASTAAHSQSASMKMTASVGASLLSVAMVLSLA